MPDVASIRRRTLPDVIPQHPGWSPRLCRLYAARGVVDPADFALRLNRLHPPHLLGGIDAAATLLADAIKRQAAIRVVGDFDCDGATGTAVAVRGLQLLGATNVGYRVPHRIEHGYGLSPALVDALADESPELVVTVDSGIACLAGVAAAKARGWQVIVTDHHLPGPTLPEADAIVNPNLEGDAFPSKALAGVGVMFYLLLATRRVLRGRGVWPDGGEPDLSVLLDLVAVGTVADLVPLDYNNRVLVAAGLQRLRRGQCQPGLRALAEVARRPLPGLTTTDIGFAIGPRINAAGRLEDMAVGVACLLSDSPGEAHRLAGLLDGINADRRQMQAQMVEEAERAVADLSLGEQALPHALVLHDAGWHPGVVGLVASKLKERAHRPVVAFAPSEPGSQLLRGSARSIPGFHIRDALADVDATQPGLVQRFGGHAMAAGLTLDRADLDAFERAFIAATRRRLAPELLEREILTDGPLEPAEFTREMAESLRAAGPWGQGFPEPVFDNVFELLDYQVLGEKHLKLRLALPGCREPLAAIHFGSWDGSPPPGRLHMAYELAVDDYRDRRGIQLLVRHRTAADG